jgi:hypothetical protein
MTDRPLTLTRAHRTRLMHIWRSAGWPCRDVLEIDLIAAELVTFSSTPDGRDTLRLTGAGFQCLAEARHHNRRASSRHDRLAERVARHLGEAGRVVWRELSLRAKVDDPAAQPAAADNADAPPCAASSLWPGELPLPEASPKTAWRIARPDVFSVRNTSVESYLQPVVHEIKVSRADLLSDLRNAAKRLSYQWLCCECYFVFPVQVAKPAEIPEAFGIWVLHGDVEDGRLELLRPARHAPCRLPFAVWLALAKATPWSRPDDDVEADSGQGHLGEADAFPFTLESPA